MIAFLSRAPFTIIGALAIFSLVSDLMTLQEDIARWADAWKAVTRPIWDYLLGWLFEWLGINFPWWMKDYFTLCAILIGMIFRSILAEDIEFLREEMMYLSRHKFLTELIKGILYSAYQAIVNIPRIVLLFPWFIYLSIYHSIIKDDGASSIFRIINEQRAVFWETAIIALILIAVNYVLISSGAQTVPPAVKTWI